MKKWEVIIPGYFNRDYILRTAKAAKIQGFIGEGVRSTDGTPVPSVSIWFYASNSPKMTMPTMTRARAA